jgi:hypothetical protein
MSWPPCRAERLARRLLIALACAAPLAFAWRALAATPAAAPALPPPAWVQIVLISADELEPWPAQLSETEFPRVARLMRRGSLVQSAFAAALEPRAAAASLWCAAPASRLGALQPEARLAADAWSLASAARAAGTRTAAFLAQPYASSLGIPGFEHVHEEVGADGARLGALAAQQLAHWSGERLLVWVHLARAGAAELDRVLGALEPAFVAEDRRHCTLTLVLGFRDPSGLPRSALLAELPHALSSGRRSAACFSQTDVPSLLTRVLRLAPQAAALDEGAGGLRAALLWGALRGGGGPDTALVEGAAHDELYLSSGAGADEHLLRARLPSAAPVPLGAFRAEVRGADGAWSPAAEASARVLLERARAGGLVDR